MESARTSYAPPVDQLLTYGEGQNVAPEKWPNYLELGLGLEHVRDALATIQCAPTGLHY